MKPAKTKTAHSKKAKGRQNKPAQGGRIKFEKSQRGETPFWDQPESGTRRDEEEETYSRAAL
jgi:hypothetical protein